MSQAVSLPAGNHPNIRTGNHPNIRTGENTATEGPAASGARATRPQKEYNVKLVEPPSCSSQSIIVFIGKNCRGNWVALEQNGLYGGLFVNRAQAIKYALFENGHHPETIVELSREIELDMVGKRASSDYMPAASPRRAA